MTNTQKDTILTFWYSEYVVIEFLESHPWRNGFKHIQM